MITLRRYVHSNFAKFVGIDGFQNPQCIECDNVFKQALTRFFLNDHCCSIVPSILKLQGNIIQAQCIDIKREIVSKQQHSKLTISISRIQQTTSFPLMMLYVCTISNLTKWTHLRRTIHNLKSSFTTIAAMRFSYNLSSWRQKKKFVRLWNQLDKSGRGDEKWESLLAFSADWLRSQRLI